MEDVGRFAAAAQWARKYRVAAIVAAFVVSVLLGLWNTTAGISSLIATLAVVLFLLLPGIETVVRNFRQGYRGES
jgi:Kef-type K+ transport system membrane component KefB